MNTHSTINKSSIQETPISDDDGELINDAFTAGRESYLYGNSCPYEPRTTLFHVWTIGFDSAALDADLMGVVQ